MRRVVAFVVGALAFWLPAALVALTTRMESDYVLFNLVPAASVTAAFLLARKAGALARGDVVYVLAGLYVLAPTFMGLINGGFGGGFPTLEGAHKVAMFLAWSLVPPVTLLLAVSGAIALGMIAATGALLWGASASSSAPAHLWRRYTGRNGPRR